MSFLADIAGNFAGAMADKRNAIQDVGALVNPIYGLSEVFDGEPVNDSQGGLVSAAKNWMYGITGQTEKTSAYQKQMEREDSAYQRSASDMSLAGLSKFGGVSPASADSYGGSEMKGLSYLSALAQIKNMNIENDVAEYNFDKAKEWGVPTSAVGDFAKYDALSKVLFGKSINSIVGDNGVFGLLGLFGDGNGPFVGVSEDAGKALGESLDLVKDMRPLNAYPYSKPDDFGVFKNNLEKATKNFTGSIQGDYLRHLMKVSVDDLMKYRGFDWDSAAHTVNKWTRSLLCDYPGIDSYMFILHYPESGRSGEGYGGGGGYTW